MNDHNTLNNSMENDDNKDNKDNIQISRGIFTDRITTAHQKFMYDHNKDASLMKKFLNQHKSKELNKESTIIKVCGSSKGSYFINNEQYLITFFNQMENLYNKKINMGLAEKQLLNSGIMLDFDLYQLNNKTVLEVEDYFSLIKLIFESIIYYGDFSEYTNLNTYAIVLKRPVIKFNDKKALFKDGFHILIPKLCIRKIFKKLIIKRVKEKNSFKNIFRECKLPKNYDYSEILDKNSASVPVFFIGQDREKFLNSYKIKYVIEFKTKNLKENVGLFNTINVTDSFLKKKDLNIVNELSLNWESQQKYIKKINIKLKLKHIQLEIQELKEDKFMQNDICDSLSLNLAEYPILLEIREIIKILPLSFLKEYNNWIKIIMALKSYSERTKIIAYELTKKIKKEKRIKNFETHWNSIKKDYSGKSVTINSLHFFAKKEAPHKYKLLLKDMTLTKAIELAMDPNKAGILGHTDIAEIAYGFNRYKYKTTYLEGSIDLIWYEFMDINSSSLMEHEVYKWKKHIGEPITLRKFITSNNSGIKKIISNLIQQSNNSLSEVDEQYKKWYMKLKLNLIRTLLNLSNSGFINSVMKESKLLFIDTSFGKKLDSYDNLMGVSNGVLDLKTMSLKIGWHGFEISKKTDVCYIKFDPNNKYTKELIINLRNIFPDDESDSFEFIMSYLASSLKGGTKTPKILFLSGNGANGKSTLLEIHRKALGDYARKIPTQLLTGRSSNPEGATPQLAKLKNARSAYCSETNVNECANMAKIKGLLGGELLNARNLYGNGFTITPEATLILASNNVLDVIDQDWGTWRRILLCIMQITFVKEPKKKNERLATNFENNKNEPKILEAYLSLLTYFYMRTEKLYNNNFMSIPHQHIKKYTEQYKYTQNKIEQFIDDVCIVKNNNTQILKFVIGQYKIWYQIEFGSENKNNEYIKKLFLNSKISKYISFDTDINEYVIEGLEFTLNKSNENSKYYFKNINKKKKIFINNKKETSEEYYKRLVDEFNIFKQKYHI